MADELNLMLTTGHLAGTFYLVDDDGRVHRVLCQKGQTNAVLEHWVVLGAEGSPVILSSRALERDRFFEERVDA